MRHRTLVALLVFILFITLRLPLQAQSEWMWLEGSNQTNQKGSFGTLGVPSFSNIPSARSSPAMWADKSGEIWFFGGSGYDATGATGTLNDLWTFDPSTLQWTWMGGSQTAGQAAVYGTLGVPSSTNTPGARSGANTWTDGNGNFWLFSGNCLNDLWMYSPSTAQWMWVAGSDTGNQPGIYGTQGVPSNTNTPGSRCDATNWTDANGRFWLFGGSGVDSTGASGLLNDLWMFDPSTWEWTWMGGSDTANQLGVYGTLGVADPANVPGGRSGATASVDKTGNVWLWGGTELLLNWNNAPQGYDGDQLWVFNSTTNEWTWMSGYNVGDYHFDEEFLPNFGTLGVFSSSTLPGSVEGPTSWTDANGNFWLFDGYISYGALENWFTWEFNSIWEFDPSTKEWAWMGGFSGGYSYYQLENAGGNLGVYGAQGVPDPSNVPGGRQGATVWSDRNGNVWLFAGFGCCYDDAYGDIRYGDFNDLWIFGSNFNLQATPIVSVAPPQSSVGLEETFPVVVTVTGGPVPTGSVTLAGGSFTLPATTLNQGSANIEVPAGSFSLGPATLTATYTPDAAGSIVYKGASGKASLTVVNSTYSLSATKLTLSPGASANSTVTVSSSSGYAGTVSFTCAVTSSLSGGVDPPTCAANDAVTLSASTATATVSITVSTIGPSSTATAWPNLHGAKEWNGLEAVVLLLFATCLGMSSRCRRSMSVLSVVLLSAIVGSLLGCGGSSTKGITNAGTTPGTYTVTVTGTGNDASATKVTTTFTLIVS
jgi:hypothetical protein